MSSETAGEKELLRPASLKKRRQAIPAQQYLESQSTMIVNRVNANGVKLLNRSLVQMELVAMPLSLLISFNPAAMKIVVL